MKPRTAKLLLHISTGAIGALGDLAMQLQGGQLVNASRVVLFGVGLSLFVKVAGVGLAYLVEQAAVRNTPPEPPRAPESAP